MAEFASLAGTLSIADPSRETAEASPEPEAESLLLRPHVALELVHYTPEMLELVPREIAERHCLLPVYLRKARPRRKIPGVLFLAMANPADTDALEECGFCSGLAVKPLMAERWALQDAIPIVYAGGSPLWVRVPPPASAVTPPPPPVQPAPPAAPPPTAAPPATLPAASAEPVAAPVAAASLPPVAAARSAETTVEVSEASLDDLGDLGDLGDLEGHGGASDGASTAGGGDGEPADTVRDPDEPRYGFDTAEKSTPARRSEKPEPAPGFVLLVVSASAALADFCREAAEPLGGRIDTCDVVEAPLLALAERPRFLIVSEEIYPFDRRAFNLLALEIGAPLVVWSLDMTPEDLQALLLAAGKKRPGAPAT